uniref:Uncharacterized protein n=1 Tax=Dromaius novaehollandiae TaxID=8790 RepID=A0A8C4JJL9_DRONO
MDVGLLKSAAGKEEAEPIAWGPEGEQAFRTMKGALASAPALGLPDYTNRVMRQKLGPPQRPVAYSAQLDSVAAGAPACIKSVVAAAAIIERAARSQDRRTTARLLRAAV